MFIEISIERGVDKIITCVKCFATILSSKKRNTLLQLLFVNYSRCHGSMKSISAHPRDVFNSKYTRTRTIHLTNQTSGLCNQFVFATINVLIWFCYEIKNKILQYEKKMRWEVYRNISMINFPTKIEEWNGFIVRATGKKNVYFTIEHLKRCRILLQPRSTSKNENVFYVIMAFLISSKALTKMYHVSYFKIK